MTGLFVFALSASVMPPVLGSLPHFSLVAHDGTAVSRDRLAGRVVVADFIFTRCGGVCPAMTAQLARLQNQLPDGTQLVSFTVDPVFDTAPVLARYAKAHEAGPGWLFVTGPLDDLHALATRGFKLAAMEVSPDQQRSDGDGPFLHSSKFVLVDGGGAIRGYYDSEEATDRRRLVRAAALVGPYGVLPRVNAALNSASAVLLAFGYVLIRSGRRAAHRNCMVAALACSGLFLTAYLVYHAHVGSIRFPLEGAMRAVYLTVLLTHTALAVVILPLIAVTLGRALRQRFDRHRRLGRLTLPLWAYVSVTGVAVFWMLYRF